MELILILSSINVRQASFSAEDTKIEKKIQLSLKYKKHLISKKKKYFCVTTI